jgi:hypothetical protein
LWLAWEKREARIHSYEKREGKELNVKKYAILACPIITKCPCGWYGRALLNKFRDPEMHF